MEFGILRFFSTQRTFFGSVPEPVVISKSYAMNLNDAVLPSFSSSYPRSNILGITALGLSNTCYCLKNHALNNKFIIKYKVQVE